MIVLGILTIHTWPATSCFKKPLDFRTWDFDFGPCRGSLLAASSMWSAYLGIANQTPVMQEARIIESHVDHPHIVHLLLSPDFARKPHSVDHLSTNKLLFLRSIHRRYLHGIPAMRRVFGRKLRERWASNDISKTNDESPQIATLQTESPTSQKSFPVGIKALYSSQSSVVE